MFGADATVGTFFEERPVDESRDQFDYLFPSFIQRQPWKTNKTGANYIPEDFILIAEFSEQEGPRPVITIPKDGGGQFDKNEFSVKILSVDHQSSIVENTDLSEDTQVVMSDEEKQVHAFVHHLVLNDIHARGYVRPLCITYVTPDSRKLMTCYEELSTQMKRVARLMQYGNRLVFMRDLEKHLEDLSYTKAHLLITQSSNSRGLSSTSENELLNVLNTLRQSIEEVTTTISKLKPLLVDKELEEKFENLEKHMKPGHQDDSTSLKGFNLDRTLLEDGLASSLNEFASSEFSLFHKSKDLKPKILDVSAIRGKRRFDRSLRGLHELCSWGAKEGLQRLRLVREFFKRDLSSLQIDELDTSILQPSCSVLMFGPDLLGANFLSGHKRSHVKCGSRRQFSYTSDSLHSWASTGSQDSFKSPFSSFHSAVDDEDIMISARSSYFESFVTLDRLDQGFSMDSQTDSVVSQAGQDGRMSDQNILASHGHIQERRFSDQTEGPSSRSSNNQDKPVSMSEHHSCKHCSMKDTDAQHKDNSSSGCTCRTVSANDTVIEGGQLDDRQGCKTKSKDKRRDDRRLSFTEYEEFINIEIEKEGDLGERQGANQIKGHDPAHDKLRECSCETLTSCKHNQNNDTQTNGNDDISGSKTDTLKDSSTITRNPDNPDDQSDRLDQDKKLLQETDQDKTELAAKDNGYFDLNTTSPDDQKKGIVDVSADKDKENCDISGNAPTEGPYQKVSKCDKPDCDTVRESKEKPKTPEPVQSSTHVLHSLQCDGCSKISPCTTCQDTKGSSNSGGLVARQHDNSVDYDVASHTFSSLKTKSSSDSCIVSLAGRASTTGCTKDNQTDTSCDQRNKSRAWCMRHKRRLKMKMLFKENIETDYGLQKMLTSYNNIQHVVYSLLSGRPVIVIGTKRQETQIREIVNALRVFMPVISSDHVTLLCQIKQMRLVDVHQFRLAGIIRPDKKSLDYIVPHSIRRFLTLFDVERLQVQCQPYQGTLLGFVSAISNKKKVFRSEQALHTFIQLNLMEIGTRTFSFYHSVSIGDHESTFSGASVLRRSAMLDLSAEKYLNKYNLSKCDCRIVKALAETIKIQQIEQEFKWKSLTDCPVYPFPISYQATQIFRCGQGR